MGFTYHPYIDSIIILSNNNIILFGFKMGMSSAIIYSDYKSFIFPTLFYYNVSLYSTILLLSSGRSFGDNEFTYAFLEPDSFYLIRILLVFGRCLFASWKRDLLTV